MYPNISMDMDALINEWHFIADAMFGKLGNFLRILGFDVELANNVLTDNEIFKQAQATQRIIITRDKLFYQKMHQQQTTNKINAIFINARQLKQQLLLLFTQIKCDPTYFLETPVTEWVNRCSVCNAHLKPISKELVRGLVPAGSIERFEHFWQCTNPMCKKIFWIGRHWNSIQETLKWVAENFKENKI